MRKQSGVSCYCSYKLHCASSYSPEVGESRAWLLREVKEERLRAQNGFPSLSTGSQPDRKREIQILKNLDDSDEAFDERSPKCSAKLSSALLFHDSFEEPIPSSDSHA